MDSIAHSINASTHDIVKSELGTQENNTNEAWPGAGHHDPSERWGLIHDLCQKHKGEVRAINGS